MWQNTAEDSRMSFHHAAHNFLVALHKFRANPPGVQMQKGPARERQP